MKAKGTKIAKNNNANVENPLGVLPVKPSYGLMYYKNGWKQKTGFRVWWKKCNAQEQACYAEGWPRGYHNDEY